MSTPLGRFARDIEFCHQRRWPGRPATPLSRLRLVASSRGLWLALVHRLSHWWVTNWVASEQRDWRLRVIGIPLSLLEWAIKVATKSDIIGRSEIEGGVCFADEGCIIFGARRMGGGTVIGARTTIGMGLADGGLPDVGRNVWIGDDCVVYGAITIGDGATLLPGTALTRSIPAGVVMQGNPARLVLRTFDNTTLRKQPGIDAAGHVAAWQGP